MHTTITVAIQGEEASFHEIAALRHYNEPITLIYCQTFEMVFSKLANHEVDRAFVAVSNSNHGEIEEVTRLLEVYKPANEGEYLLPIEQHIIGHAGVDLADVRTVISHPVALSQCGVHLETHFGHVRQEEYHDTSAAVAHVGQQEDRSLVAIGSERAAELYGLTILKRAIQDDADNATLFRSLRRA